MKKLTAGIFAGILTIVTVNAANASIASKAYVDQQRDGNKTLIDANAGEITTLKSTVGGHTTSINALTDTVGNDAAGLVKDVKDLQDSVSALGGGDGSIGDQITAAIEGLDSSVENADGVISTITVTDGMISAARKALTNADVDANAAIAQSKIANLTTDLAGKVSTTDAAANGEYVKTANTVGANLVALDAQVKTNTTDIATVSGKIGTVPADKTVVGLIDDAKTAATGDINAKLGDGFSAENTVASVMETKQATLGATNVTKSGEGNVVTGVTAADGVVTVATGNAIMETAATGEDGTYVLTATIADGKVSGYKWESIQRTMASE